MSTTDTARALNQLGREQMRLRILADIAIDLTVCELEGWDQREYLHDLHGELADRCPCSRERWER